MILSMFMLCISSVQTTYGYLTVSTQPITNIFIPNEQFALKIVKQLQHPYGEEYQIPDSIQFTFDIDFGEKYKNKKFETSNGTLKTNKEGHLLVSLKPNEAFYIKGFSENQHIVVTELNSNLTGFSIVGEAVQVVDVNEATNAEMIYTNKYTPIGVYGSIIEVDGYKTIEGYEYCDKDRFTYVLEYYDDGEWVKIKDTSIIYKDEEENILDIPNALDKMLFEKLGEHEFRIREKNDDQDEEIRYFKVVISDDDMDGYIEIKEVYGEEDVEVKWEDGRFHVSAYFKDKYEPTEDMKEPLKKVIQIHKKVTNKGELKSSLKGFEFVLENMETHEKIKSYSDERGNAYFTLEYDLDDLKKEFKYYIYETNQGVKGMTYDSSLYKIEVKVDLNKEQKLKGSVLVNGKKYDQSKITFHNIYQMNKNNRPPTGDQTHLLFWMGMALLSGTSFIILLFYDPKDKKACENMK